MAGLQAEVAIARGIGKPKAVEEMIRQINNRRSNSIWLRG
jgi:hypothetical protein